MRAQPALVLTFGLLTAMPAAAEERPAVMQPARDVMVEYRALGASRDDHRSNTVRMYFTDHGLKLRIEPVGQPAYSIVDRRAQHMTMVMTAQRAYMEMPYDAKRVMAFDDPDATFARRGSDTVAGMSCTLYDVRRQNRSGQVCISDDGLLLRARSDDPAQANGTLEATSVTYGPQPASLFLPPPDFQKMDMALMPRRAP